MANGDDKKKNLPAGQHSGYTGYVDNLGGAQYYQGEVDEGGGSYSVSGERGATRTVGTKVDDLTLFNQFNNKTNIAEGFDPNWGGPSDPNYKAWLTKIEEKRGYRGKKDKQYHSFTKTSANNVVNTNNNNSSNGNTGNIGGGTNIATATGGNASIGNINIGNTKSPTTTSSSNKVQATIPTKNSNSGSSTTSSTTGNTRGYSGNSPFNQATATGGNASIGNITINTGGDGAKNDKADPPKPNITGQNSPLGGGAKGLMSNIVGGGSRLGVRKTQGGDPTQPGGPVARRGSSTPYQMRGLQNQFQSWAMNHYNNTNNAT